MDLLAALRNPVAFRDYFKGTWTESQDRWDHTLNNLSERNVRDIVSALELFKAELEFVLSTTEINDDDVLVSLRGLTEILYRTKYWGHDYDSMKPLSQFMWQSCAGWSPIQGYTGLDPIELHIGRM